MEAVWPSVKQALRSAALVGALLVPLALSASPAGARPVAEPVTAAAPVAASDLPLLAPLSDGVEVELPPTGSALPSPARFLGYPLGTRFTHHHRILDYLESLAAASPRVTTWQYGETYLGRPLTLVAISSPENIARLEELRQARQRLLDPAVAAEERGRLARQLPAVAWLAYGVHGNESSSAEVSMAAAWIFASAAEASEDWNRRLEGTIVLIDPLVNPDGRERYVSFYEEHSGRVPEPSPLAAEHWESWPGGRQNHYLIDLNRDWSWASQQETRHRLEAYRLWEPQVYVDFHEMFGASSYFFPPVADPVNPLIDRRTVDWLEVFGKANAEAFDRQGWTYFKGETFDLFYPGYGDSYPAFRGAVGMTYEMAGHGRAGAALELRDGTVLTLADRIARHLTTSLATVETTTDQRDRLMEDFTTSRVAAATTPGPAFFWSADAPEARQLAELLQLHGVAVGRLREPQRLPLRSLTDPSAWGEDADTELVALAAGTFVVDSRQSLGRLARTLLSREAELSEEFMERQRELLESSRFPEFYDITSWSLPLAYNLEAWEAEAQVARRLESEVTPFVGGHPGGGTKQEIAAEGAFRPTGDARVGFLVPPAGIAGYRMVAGLFEADIQFRVALEDFAIEGRRYPRGTLFVPRLPNARGSRDGEAPRDPEALDRRLAALAGEIGVEVVGVSTSYTADGPSLGSDQTPVVVEPVVGLLSGRGVSATSFGFLWHLLDRQTQLPHLRVDLDTLGRLDLSRFDVLVMPDGYYGDALAGETGDALQRWLEAGGLLVAVDGAFGWLEERELTGYETWQADEEEITDDRPLVRVPVSIPGATLATRMAPHHPLTLGLASPPPVLVGGSRVILASGDPGRDALTVAPEDPVLGGVVWPEVVDRLAGSLVAGTESAGRGTVVLLASDPVFRLFWRGTAPLFLNAVTYGPSLTGGRGGYAEEEED